MTFKYGPVPDPDKDGIMECYHYRNAVDDYDRAGALMDSPMLHGWFVYNVVELAMDSDDAISTMSPRDIFEKLEEFRKDATAFNDMCEDHQCRVDLDEMEYQRQCAH